MKRSLLLVLASLVAVAICIPAFAGDMAKNGKSRYLIIASHTPEQCLAALENVEKVDKKALAKWDFGCKDNDHTGYLVVTAASADEALMNVPEAQRMTAKAIRLTKFTPADIKAAHEMMEKKS